MTFSELEKAPFLVFDFRSLPASKVCISSVSGKTTGGVVVVVVVLVVGNPGVTFLLFLYNLFAR